MAETVIGTLPNNRTLVEADITQVLATGSGTLAIVATVSYLRSVEFILGWNLVTTPIMGTEKVENTSIAGNVVGGTISNIAGGTTVTGTVTVVGF